MINNRVEVSAVEGDNYIDLITQIHLFLENLRKLEGILESKDVVSIQYGRYACFFWYLLPAGKKIDDIGFKVK